MEIDKRYENALLGAFFLTCGALFLDRLSVLYLAPFIAPELHLTNSEVGLLASVVAVTWAVSGLLFGAVSDRIGRRPVLIPMVFAFSVLTWLSGVAGTLGQLLGFRALMGFAGGATWSTMTATLEESSVPARRGRNIGIVVSATALVGTGLAPILLTQVAVHFGWRKALFAAGAPGLILGCLLWKLLRESKERAPASHIRGASMPEVLSVLRYRNVVLSCIAAVGFMTWLWVMSAFAPLYMTQVGKSSATTAGFVLGATGLGGFFWGFCFPTLSDRIGRKPVLYGTALLSSVVPLTFQIPYLQSHSSLLAAAGFIANGGQGIAALALVLVPVESVPATVRATAIGLVAFVGEILGGTVAPTLAGKLADIYGLSAPLWVASAGTLIVLFAALGMTETAPARAAKPVAA